MTSKTPLSRIRSPLRVHIALPEDARRRGVEGNVKPRVKVEFNNLAEEARQALCEKSITRREV